MILVLQPSPFMTLHWRPFNIPYRRSNEEVGTCWYLLLSTIFRDPSGVYFNFISEDRSVFLTGVHCVVERDSIEYVFILACLNIVHSVLSCTAVSSFSSTFPGSEIIAMTPYTSIVLHITRAMALSSFFGLTLLLEIYIWSLTLLTDPNEVYNSWKTKVHCRWAGLSRWPPERLMLES